MEDKEEIQLVQLEAALEKERIDFTEKISEVIRMISDINKLSDAQVLMLSYRQIMVDKLIKYRAINYKKKASDQNIRRERHEFHKTQHNFRLEYKEINEFVASDMSLRIRKTDMIDNQIDYYSKSIETLDKLGFAIKSKITIEEMNDKRNF